MSPAGEQAIGSGQADGAIDRDGRRERGDRCKARTANRWRRELAQQLPSDAVRRRSGDEVWGWQSIIFRRETASAAKEVIIGRYKKNVAPDGPANAESRLYLFERCPSQAGSI